MWKCRSVEVWKCGSVEVRKSGNMQMSLYLTHITHKFCLDLVMWKWNGEVSSHKMGLIVSDYKESRSKDGSIIKNVFWFDQQWVRPIEQQYLEVISESR